MATPILVTVTGHVAGRGTVVFTRHRALISAVDDTVIPPGQDVAELDASGDFTIALYATNDPDWLPADWSYSVRVNAGGGMRGSMHLDYHVTAVDFDDVLDVAVPATQGQTYVPLSKLGAVDGVATLGADGILSAPQRPTREDLRIFTGPTPPGSPAEGDIWFDTSGA